ncbi:hypothetical protein UlMin_031307 [Ulmus minor]
MEEMVMKHVSHWLWSDNHNNTTSKRSPWLQSTLIVPLFCFPLFSSSSLFIFLTSSGSSTSDSAESSGSQVAETCDPEDSAESEVDNPEKDNDQQGDGTPVQEKLKEEFPDKVRKLQEELMSLGEENRAQKEQLKQKDEEKIEVIRQLSMAVDMLKEENVELRKCLAKESPKRSNPFDFNKIKGAIFGNLFNGSQKHHGTILAQ